MEQDTKPKPRFSIGTLYATPGAIEASGMVHILGCLGRHMLGDWGITCDDDKAINDDAAATGGRILSAYAIDETKPAKGYGDNVLWLITEADRSVTTALLPDEY